MADYVDLPNSALDGDSPGTQTIFEALRDNPIAITEGAAGAPRVQTDAIANGAITGAKVLDGTITPDKLYPANVGEKTEAISTTLNSTTSTSYVKKKEMALKRGGSFRVRFGLHTEVGGSVVYGRIYKNGVAVGTERSTEEYSTSPAYFEEDISGWSSGDNLQLYIKSSSTFYHAYTNLLEVKTDYLFQAEVTLE